MADSQKEEATNPPTRKEFNELQSRVDGIESDIGKIGEMLRPSREAIAANNMAVTKKIKDSLGN